MPGNKGGNGGWRIFLWNSEKKAFLGRTGESWFKIFIFYLILYGCLAGFFILTLKVSFLTLSNTKPKYQDRVLSPGMAHIPRTSKSEIFYTVNDEKSYGGYVKAMKELLELYDDNLQDDMKYEDCGDSPHGYTERGPLDQESGVRKACRFKRSWLSGCSGLDEPSFGYKQGTPCVIVKLNRIIGFRPRPPTTNVSLPVTADGKAPENYIPIFCSSKTAKDANKILDIKYFGVAQGFPLQYYPYYGKLLHPDYLQPLVGIQFNITKNMKLHIQCKVYGENINYIDKDNFLGRFKLTMMVKL